jgi:hypothetical protein
VISRSKFHLFKQIEQSNITDTMITAGSDAFEEFWVDLASPAGAGLALVPKLVERIYSVMETARQSSPNLCSGSIVKSDG